jgi:hypothetical protein
MIVKRTLYNIKQGRMREALELLKESEAQVREDGFTGAFRIYMSSIGKLGQLAYEWEHASLAEYEKAESQWVARPTTPAWMEKWHGVWEGGGISEIWRIPD